MDSVWKVGISRRFLFLGALSLRGQGWETLFDGRSTAGWIPVAGREFPSESWVVRDGCLEALVHDPTFQDIRTEREFGDFELEFEWKIAAGGNGGVKYLITKYDAWMPKGATGGRGQERARGCEYQLTDDALSEETKRDRSRGTGSLYAKIAPEGAAARAAGEWNASRIVVKRPAIEHWLNGKRVVATRLEGELPARSAIALQNHHAGCWFRGIRVREL